MLFEVHSETLEGAESVDRLPHDEPALHPAHHRAACTPVAVDVQAWPGRGGVLLGVLVDAGHERGVGGGREAEIPVRVPVEVQGDGVVGPQFGPSGAVDRGEGDPPPQPDVVPGLTLQNEDGLVGVIVDNGRDPRREGERGPLRAFEDQEEDLVALALGIGDHAQRHRHRRLAGQDDDRARDRGVVGAGRGGSVLGSVSHRDRGFRGSGQRDDHRELGRRDVPLVGQRTARREAGAQRDCGVVAHRAEEGRHGPLAVLLVVRSKPNTVPSRA